MHRRGDYFCCVWSRGVPVPVVIVIVTKTPEQHGQVALSLEKDALVGEIFMQVPDVGGADGSEVGHVLRVIQHVVQHALVKEHEVQQAGN